jgi:hypothetical protein
MAETVYHMVHYREFSHDSAGLKSKSLETLVREQLSGVGSSGLPRWEAIEDRVLDLGSGDGMEVVLNRVADLSSAIFGEMCLVHSNGVQALLKLTAEKHQASTITLAEVYSLMEESAPRGSKYVRGLAYFLAIGNHLFFIRTQSLVQETIEAYINWLLRQGVSGLGADDSMELSSQFDKSALAGDIGDIRSLRVGGPTFPQMNIKPVTEIQQKERATTRKIADKFVQFGQAFDLASALLGPARAQMLAESLGPKERLVVDAVVKVQGTRTDESKKQLAALAKELDSLTEGKVTVEGKDGKITDKDAILRTNMPFNHQKDGHMLLDFYNVADQLQKVYQRFVDDKKIKA